MPGLSNYAENKLLDHLLGGPQFTPPGSIWMALFKSDPGEDGSGLEVSGNGYSRTQITFAAAIDGVCTNNAEVTFPVPQAPGWGDVSHTGLFDAQSNGNYLFGGQLSQTKTIGTGTVLKYLVGSVTASLA